jgi:ribose 5-phosphate isomerase B
MCLGNQIIGHSVAIELIDIFLKAEFSTDEDFRRRVDKLSQMES